MARHGPQAAGAARIMVRGCRLLLYYGHLYASFCIETLHSEDRPIYRQALASILVPLQEKDGSWWDFPFYDYHRQYGTAMALLSLKRCLESKKID